MDNRPYTIEFYFDATFEAMLMNVWDKLAEAGVPSYYQARGVRPHLTVAVLEHGDEVQICPIVKTFAQALPPLSITFVGVVLLPGSRCSVGLELIVTKELLDLQAALYDQLYTSGNPPVDRYAPDLWMPRGSISKNLSYPDALRTVEVCGQHIQFGSARLRELGFAEFNPRRQIMDWAL
ncbi:MAG: hypothetical protein R6W75_10040 [Smithellaceae bacterium]